MMGFASLYPSYELILKSPLQRPKLRRAPGPKGKLVKRGVFADTLFVNYD